MKIATPKLKYLFLFSLRKPKIRFIAKKKTNVININILFYFIFLSKCDIYSNGVFITIYCTNSATQWVVVKFCYH